MTQKLRPRKIQFSPLAHKDFLKWKSSDKRVYERIVTLLNIIAMADNPLDGIGKPEPLVGPLQGSFSRRITKEHRLVYRLTDDTVIVDQCRYHY